MLSNNVYNNTLLVMMTHIKAYQALVDELMLVSLEIRLCMRNMSPSQRTGFHRGDEGCRSQWKPYYSAYSSVRPVTPNWTLHSSSPSCNRITCSCIYPFFLLCYLFICFYWFVEVFCILNHCLLQVFQIPSSLTLVFEFYFVV